MAITSEDLAEWYRHRPRPQSDNVSRRYWDSLARGELLYQACERCSNVQFYPRAICTKCGSEPIWRASNGQGTVHTYTVIRQNGASPFHDQLPYVVAIVDVEPGFRLMGNILGIDPGEVQIGMAVTAEFVTVDEGYAVPVWRRRVR